VGQMVDLKAEVLAPPGFVTTNPSYEWAVPGVSLYSYSPIDTNDAVGKVVYLAGDNGANTGTLDQEVKFAWVYGGTFGVGLLIKNVNGQIYQALTTFDVETPSVTESVKTGGAPGISPDNGDFWLSATGIGEAINITASVQNPTNLNNGGTWTFLQMANPILYWYTGTPDNSQRWHLSSNDVWGLDTQFPAPGGDILDQNGNPVLYNLLSPGQEPYTFIDDPEENLTLTLGGNTPYRASFTDIFKNYIMYKPVGSGSIWVPLYEITWSVGAAAQFIADAWTVTSFSAPQWWQNSNAWEPQWNLIQPNGSVLEG
jgi:hypothetical protein